MMIQVSNREMTVIILGTRKKYCTHYLIQRYCTVLAYQNITVHTVKGIWDEFWWSCKQLKWQWPSVISHYPVCTVSVLYSTVCWTELQRFYVTVVTVRVLHHYCTGLLNQNSE